MKKILFLITIVFAINLISSCQKSTGAGTMIKELDKAIESRAEYFARHRHKMDSIKAGVGTCANDRELYALYKKLHLSYTTFSIDSAAHYAAKMEELALKTNDKELSFQSAIARITVLHAQFEYGEGRKRFEQLDTTGISIESLAEYWASGTRLYRDILRYTECAESERQLYAAQLARLRKDMSQRGFHVSRECRLKTALMHIDNGNRETA